MFADDPPRLLRGDNFSLITSQGKPVCIGQGGKSSILLAQDHSTLALVAVKLIQGKNNVSLLSALLQEYGYQRKASRVFCNGKAVAPKPVGILRLTNSSPLAKQNNPYMLVSEYFPLAHGVPQSLALDRAIHMHNSGRKLLTNEQWAQVSLDILEVVNALNMNNIVHLDIKPGNILLHIQGSEIRPVVIDYGISRSFTDTVRFSPHPEQDKLYPHNAPELFSETDEVTPLPTSDLYGVAHVIIKINTILDSPHLDTELRSYRALSPSMRHGYLQLRGRIEKQLDNLVPNPSYDSVDEHVREFASQISFNEYHKEFKLEEECYPYMKDEQDKRINHIINTNSIYKSMFADDPPRLLRGDNFSLITSQGKPVCIGQGGKSSILLAQDHSTLALVAVKLIQGKNNVSLLSALLQEYGYQRKASRVFCNGKAVAPKPVGILRLTNSSPLAKQNNPYMLVSEYFPLAHGVPQSLALDRAIHMHNSGRKLLTNEQWAQVSLDILEVVNALNMNNIVHLDIKPGNILLHIQGSEIRPVVIDYGISRSFTDTVRFSPHPEQDKLYPHNAPELFSETDEVTPLPTSDLYGVAHVIIKINTILDSPHLDTELRSYRALSPLMRHGYLQLRGSIEKHSHL